MLGSHNLPELHSVFLPLNLVSISAIFFVDHELVFHSISGRLTVIWAAGLLIIL